MAKVLVSDPIVEAGLAVLREAAEVDYSPGLSSEELLERIPAYDALMVRSETRVTEAVFASGKQLKVVGRAGVGVDNIDVEAATRHGVIVLNSPDGNTIAAAELSFALLLGLARKVPQAAFSLRRGEWKRSKFVGMELYKKTLGIAGLGKIGREVARRARAFDMRVLSYDPYLPEEHARQLGAEPVKFVTLLAQSDYLTLHTPLTEHTRHLLNRETLAHAKPGIRIVNCARGEIIDLEALAEALESGRVAAVALDVFPQEPPSIDLPVFKFEQNILTPHLGASTEEAQAKVAMDVAEQIAAVLTGGSARSPINLPAIPAELLTKGAPALKLAEKMGRLLAQLTHSPIASLQAHFEGEWEGLPLDLVARSAMAGLIAFSTDELVNLVNAPLYAQQRGLKLSWSHQPESDDYHAALTLIAHSDTHHEQGQIVLTGALFGKQDMRITHMNGLFVDIVPEGILLATDHRDRPGIIGRVGTLLGEHQINIAGMHVGREGVGGNAMMFVKVDNPIPPDLLETIQQMEGVDHARVLIF